MNIPSEDPNSTLSQRAVHVLIATAVALAIMGYFAGTRTQSVDIDAGRLAPASPVEGVKPAPTYLDLQRLGPIVGHGNGPTELERLRSLGPGRLDPVTQAPEARESAVETRAQIRAYDGAPPMIPHPVAQRGAPPCLACHETGLDVDGRTAPRMSHRPITNCQQCHATVEWPFPSQTARLEPEMPPNTFVGMVSPSTGERAWAGAPPTIPHSTWMRDQCMSCHGVHGQAGLRTSHPWRESCTQCHAPSAALDQRPSSLKEKANREDVDDSSDSTSR